MQHPYSHNCKVFHRRVQHQTVFAATHTRYCMIVLFLRIVSFCVDGRILRPFRRFLLEMCWQRSGKTGSTFAVEKVSCGRYFHVVQRECQDHTTSSTQSREFNLNVKTEICDSDQMWMRHSGCLCKVSCVHFQHELRETKAKKKALQAQSSVDKRLNTKTFESYWKIGRVVRHTFKLNLLKATAGNIINLDTVWNHSLQII